MTPPALPVLPIVLSLLYSLLMLAELLLLAMGPLTRAVALALTLLTRELAEPRTHELRSLGGSVEFLIWVEVGVEVGAGLKDMDEEVAGESIEVEDVEYDNGDGAEEGATEEAPGR